MKKTVQTDDGRMAYSLFVPEKRVAVTFPPLAWDPATFLTELKRR